MPAVRLNWDDHLVQRRCLFTRQPVWAVRSRKVSWLATSLNLYLALNALRSLHAVQPFSAEHYAVSSLSPSAACVERRGAPAASPANANATSTNSSSAGSSVDYLFGALAASVRELRNHVIHEAESSSSQLDYT